ncbi:MAG: carbon-nitrogen hydrolase family protein [Alphaproteobacteria bacterium]|nr:carbon-nitrogen hydrolase family protein [Alphaproteobacteria bacterium]
MSFKAGLVQLRSGTDEGQNLSAARALIREAAAKGADFITTPEITNLFEPDRKAMAAKLSPQGENISVRGFSELAKEIGRWLHIGSLALKSESGLALNRSLIFAPDGRIAASYDKVHLFDVDLPNGDKYRESEAYQGGKDAVVVDLPFCALGLAICYDVRFPALFNTLANAGANVLVAPAAFTVPTGQAHWHVLQRARAIETGSFMITAAQGGDHKNGRATYGHSLVVNPWGEVIAELPHDEPGVLLADIDVGEAAKARARIPALANARPFALKRLNAMAM